jgi:hypothetical protein
VYVCMCVCGYKIKELCLCVYVTSMHLYMYLTPSISMYNIYLTHRFVLDYKIKELMLQIAPR